MKWINVKDKIPEEGETVLTFSTKDRVCKIDHLIYCSGFEVPCIWSCRLSDEHEYITHWMPLPLPPPGCLLEGDALVT